MTSWICYGIAGCLALIGAVVLPESVREARRISRLSHEGRQLAAEITRIDEVSESTDSDDRARYGPTKIVEYATVRYAIDGAEYQTRHRLPEPTGRHRLGDRIAIVVLSDAPERSYATYDVTGSWIMSIALPAILLIGAAMIGGAGVLLRGTTTTAHRPSKGLLHTKWRS